MTIPFEPVLFGIKINIHLVLEYLAFFLAFRYYLWIRKRSDDAISGTNRLSIILGAAIGALLGSRIMGYLENPIAIHDSHQLFSLLQVKSIMGGLFGGLLGVELSKKIIGEKRSSGDMFTYPIILGIFIGRIGCFLSGTNEFTYGKPSKFFLAMDLGDGLSRHPVSLYEIFFLIILFISLKRTDIYFKQESGLLFKVFMVSYFGFRFFLEFLKPNVFYPMGLSTIQWLCILCWLYYLPTIRKLTFNAH